MPACAVTSVNWIGPEGRTSCWEGAVAELEALLGADAGGSGLAAFLESAFDSAVGPLAGASRSGSGFDEQP